MINIITNMQDKLYEYYFDDCEAFFKAKIHSKSFTEDDLNAIKKIDNAILLNKDTGTIQTDFGCTYIDNLSSGCKVVLTFLYILRNKNQYDGKIILDVTECGANALDLLFDFAEQYQDIDITFLLRHKNNLFKCKSHDYVVDGKRKKRLF